MLVLTFTSHLNIKKLLNAPGIFSLRSEMGKNKDIPHKAVSKIKEGNRYKVIDIG